MGILLQKDQQQNIPRTNTNEINPDPQDQQKSNDIINNLQESESI